MNQWHLLFFLHRHDERLTYQDLNDYVGLNTIKDEKIEELWSPKITFLNAQGPYSTVVDKHTQAYIIKKANGTASGNERYSEGK